MASVSLRQVPDHVHRQLKQRAKAARRSLNQEILRALEIYLRQPEPDEDVLDNIRSLRSRVAVEIDDEFLAEYKAEGRS